MELGLRHTQTQTQKQKLQLNQRVMQSLEVLRMPIQELSDMVTQAVYDNPLLELESTARHDDEALVPLPANPEMEAVYQEERPEQAPLEVHYRDIWSGGNNGVDADRLVGRSREHSFTEMLLEQVNALTLEPEFARLCRFLVESLDRRGYLTEDMAQLARQLGCTEFELTQAVYLVQSLEPAGVGARSLKECLVLQLAQGKHLNATNLKLVNEGLQLLAAGNLAGLEKLLGVNRAAVQRAAAVIRDLNPIPSRGYYTGESDYSVVPDATVKGTPDGCEIEINDRSVPKLRLSDEYCGLLGKTPDGETRAYLQQKKTEAGRLIGAVEEREKTLVRVLRQVCSLQRAYFTDSGPLVPMKLSDLAGRLGLSVSTVSRAVQGKYIRCATGTVELRALFTTGLEDGAGGAVSAQEARRALQALVEAETPDAPLSDEDLRTALALKGIALSRRTVAKYREELGIPSSYRRRR